MISNFIVRRSSILKSLGIWILAIGAAFTITTDTAAQTYASYSIEEIKRGALAGDPEMQRRLAREYIAGQRIEKNEGEALVWLTRAGNSGDADSQYLLGNMYEYARGTSKDMTEAIRWYRKAAMQGVVSAQFNLGDSYLRGIGAQKDHTEAMKWFRMAADQKDPDAMVRMGEAYLTGKGLPMNYVEAASYLRAISYTPEKSNLQSMAQYYLGIMYRDGLYYDPDDVKASGWFKQSAQGGYPDGMYAYAEMLTAGRTGRGADKTTAWQWYRKAAESGHPQATVKIQKTDRHDGRNLPVADAESRGIGKVGAEPEEFTKAEAAVANAADSAAKGISEFTKSIGAGEFGKAISGLTGGESESEGGKSTEERAMAAAKAAVANKGTPSFKQTGAFADRKEEFSMTPAGAPAMPGFSDERTKSSAPKSADAGFKSFTSPKPKAGSGGFNSFGSGSMEKKSTTGSSFPLPSYDEEQARLKAETAARLATGAFGKSPGSASEPTTTIGGLSTETAKTTEPGGSGGNFSSSPPAKSGSTFEDPGSSGGSDAGPGKKAEAGTGTMGSKEPAGAAPYTPRTRSSGEYAAGDSGFPLGIAYITLAMATAMVFISLMFFFTFKTRVTSLESEIKKAQFELSKANVNLSSMMHQVEQLALQAPGEEESGGQGIVSLPNWGAEKPDAGDAGGFKISRPR